MPDVAGPPLSPRQIYEFDVRGYLVLPGFLDQAKVRELNEAIDQHQRRHNVSPARFPIMTAGRQFWGLMAHPKILEIARHFCGDHFRVDHIYGVQEPAAGEPGERNPPNLHGGPRANQGSFFYQWHGEKGRTGLLVFGFALEPADRGDGGLVFVPGSHKGSMAVEGNEVWMKMLGRSMDPTLVVQPILQAGDLIVFGESIVHGTDTWRNHRHRRRVVYYKYCPGHLCWRDYEQWGRHAQKMAQNPVERSLLRGPYVAGFDDSDNSPRAWDNDWREPTKIQ